MKSREEILKLWSDQDLCPDFFPVLEELLKDRETLQAKLGEERREAFHAGYKSNKVHPLSCLHKRTESYMPAGQHGKVVKRCLDCWKEV